MNLKYKNKTNLFNNILKFYIIKIQVIILEIYIYLINFDILINYF